MFNKTLLYITHSHLSTNASKQSFHQQQRKMMGEGAKGLRASYLRSAQLPLSRGKGTFKDNSLSGRDPACQTEGTPGWPCLVLALAPSFAKRLASPPRTGSFPHVEKPDSPKPPRPGSARTRASEGQGFLSFSRALPAFRRINATNVRTSLKVPLSRLLAHPFSFVDFEKENFHFNWSWQCLPSAIGETWKQDTKIKNLLFKIHQVKWGSNKL